MSDPVILEACPWWAEVAPERGGRVARLAFDGREVLDPIADWTPADRPWPAGGLYPLVPYSNRIPQGRLRFDGREVELDRFPPGSPHAIHGPGHRRPWTVLEQAADRVRLGLSHAADGDWPFAFEATLDYALSGEGFTAAIALHNRSSEMMPAGIGLHPFFHAPDGARFALRYRDRWPQAETENFPPERSAAERNWRETVSGALVHACLSGWSGEATIERADLAIGLSAGAPLSGLILYRALGSAFLCLEPVSHVTNAFGLHADGVAGTGAAFLPPGGSLAGAIRITARRP